jgi:hypothetical protein
MAITVKDDRKMKRSDLYQKFLDLLCWAKVIPVNKDKLTGQCTFNLLSFPTAISTLWLLVPLANYLFYLFFWPGTAANHKIYTTTYLSPTLVGNSTANQLDNYIETVFVVILFCLILFMPLVLGYFSALQGDEDRYVWPQRGWMLFAALIIFMIGETVPHAVTIYNTRSRSAGYLAHSFVSVQVSVADPEDINSQHLDPTF